MANLCTRVAAGTVSKSWPGSYVNIDVNTGRATDVNNYHQAGVHYGNQYLLAIPVGGAFDADLMGIQCQAFSNAAISVVSLQSSMTNLQTQVTALVSGSEVRAPNPEIIQAQATIFGAVLAAGVLIWGLKRIYNLFMHPPSGERND